jgi:hypothetical protein
MLNPNLKIGDKVILLHMDGEMMPPGLKGEVIGVTDDPFERGGKIYSVKWENGRKLSLLSVTDAWKKIETIQESKFDDVQWFINNKLIVENFDTRFLGQFLEKVRESGITNMFGASPYLYLGKKMIKHEFKYKHIHNQEAFDEVLNLADKAQSEMVQGVMRVLDKEGKDMDVNVINRYVQKYASLFLTYWIKIHNI